MGMRLTFYALGAALMLGLPSSAQQSGKAVAVPAGSAPTADYVWMNLRAGGAGGGVDVRRTDGSLVRTFLMPGPFGLNQPWDIVGVPSVHKVFVSNRGAVPGTVSVFDTDLVQFVQVVQIPGSQNLRGMSLSEDESVLYVAGEDVNGPSVFSIDPGTLAPGVRVGGVTDTGRGAEDCVVIRAANAGGSGNGPGKIYFTVRTSVPTGYIGEINLLAGGAFSSADVGLAPLNLVNLPDRMERTVDHRFVFVACSKIAPVGETLARIVRINPLIEPLNAAVSQPVVTTTIQDLAHRVHDVTWKVDGTGNNIGFIALEPDPPAGRQMIVINDTGAAIPTPLLNIAGSGTETTVKFSPRTQQIYTGENFGTANSYSMFDGSALPPAFTATQAASGGDPLGFVAMPTPVPLVADICPRAGPAQASFIVTVHGAGFLSGPGFAVQTGATPLPFTVLDSNTLAVDMGGLAVGTFGLTVINPNAQSVTFDAYYRNYLAPPFAYPAADPRSQYVLPSLTQGYRMMSLPQYSTLTALRTALAAALGPYNPVLYRVFFYRGGGYVELSTMVDDGCDLAGESFWVLTRNGAVISATEPDVRTNDGGLNRVIPLNPGFNMISLPQLNGAGAVGTIPWASVHVTTNTADFDPASPTGPVPATSAAGLLIVENAKERIGGSYFDATNLLSGQGYWVNNVNAAGLPAYLVFQPGLVTKAGTGSGAPLPPTGTTPPAPPSGISDGSAGSGGCGLLGLEALVLLAVFRRARRDRTLVA